MRRPSVRNRNLKGKVGSILWSIHFMPKHVSRRWQLMFAIFWHTLLHQCQDLPHVTASSAIPGSMNYSSSIDCLSNIPLFWKLMLIFHRCLINFIKIVHFVLWKSSIKLFNIPYNVQDSQFQDYFMFYFVIKITNGQTFDFSLDFPIFKIKTRTYIQMSYILNIFKHTF